MYRIAIATPIQLWWKCQFVPIQISIKLLLQYFCPFDYNKTTFPSILNWKWKIVSEMGYSPRTLQWRHNERDSVSNHQPHDCLLNRLFRRWSKKTSKLRVTCLCAGNSPGTGEFPAQMASYAENVSIWWRHHEMSTICFTVRISSVTS